MPQNSSLSLSGLDAALSRCRVNASDVLLLSSQLQSHAHRGPPGYKPYSSSGVKVSSVQRGIHQLNQEQKMSQATWYLGAMAAFGK